MIPKKIHYCWFSGKQLPKDFQHCIDSWKKYCPDYEIIRWDESNYNVTVNSYMEDAYKEKRWGFVPDYARFDIIFREGGFYLDTDVELVKSLDDFRNNPCYFGFEDEAFINPGLGFGAEKGNPVIQKLRDMYDRLSFYKKDGTINKTPSPYYVSEKLEALGIKRNNTLQRFENVVIYPRIYFGVMDYYTGKIHETDHMYSIHHYSCTWMTREEKKAEDRRRAYCSKYGNWLGNRMDGISKRISRINSIDAINQKNALGPMERLQEHFIYSENRNEERLRNFKQQATMKSDKNNCKNIVLLSPAVQSANIGDVIIENACTKQLNISDSQRIHKVSTHRHPSKAEITTMKHSDVVIVTGSNLLSGNLHHCQLKLPKDYNVLRQICLMGCSWSNYEEVNDFSKQFYQSILSNGWIHSVRDQFTLLQLKNMGIENVLYTGCPTMWNLTKEHVSRISVNKAKAVVMALTSYQNDKNIDSYLIQELLNLYETVYFWPQGIYDEKYLTELLTSEEKSRIIILKRDLNALKKLLMEQHPDYVGNRLHAGILAMNMGCRSFIIAIDSRTIEIGKDTNMPYILREELEDTIENKINGEYHLSIDMPWENIALWKKQF